MQLEDPLFLSTPNGLKPTARAQTLAPSWSQALALVRHTLTAPQPFSPAAPEIQVIVDHLSDSSERALVAGEIDLVITGVAKPSHEALRGEALQRLGHTRHIALRVPHFLAAPLVVAATDHIVPCPNASRVPSRSSMSWR